MVRLKLWQWVVLALPIAFIIGFVVIAAGLKIQEWRISWIWGVFTIVFVGWRWLLVRWTQPVLKQVEAVVASVSQELEAEIDQAISQGGSAANTVEAALQTVLEKSQNDRPLWEDWQTFWNRCRELVAAIAHLYYPEVKYPLLNIYIPQAYSLIRGTVDDLDQWMQKLSPALNQVTVGQAYQAYEVYQRLEPSARKLWKVWNWAQWLLNPAAALARQATQRSGDRATQQLLVNLNQLLREAALRNLCRQAVALYSGGNLADTTIAVSQPKLPSTKTQTLREILTQAEPVTVVEQKPVNLLLVGRTGAGKSSLINTLFEADRAAVNLLPSTDRIQSYEWKSSTGTALTLLDTPGYEQANRTDFREQVLDFANQADLLLLATPALDPALQMDVDFLKEVRSTIPDLPVITIVTQVDRLRPVREWEPPYDWQWGDRPKEKSIREATEYRTQQLGEWCDRVLPVVTADTQLGRAAWGMDALSVALVEAIDPAKQLRLARFLRDLEARTIAAAKIIDHYTFQMATTQGLTTFLKSPVLQFISTLTTGSPTLAYLLAEQIPVEQLPIVIGKLQMAYDLFSLLSAGDTKGTNFDLLALWSILIHNPTASPSKPAPTVSQTAWALGHALVEYWTQSLTIEQLQKRVEFYLEQV